jgi:DNA-binding MarR family transcriptional regulator
MSIEPLTGAARQPGRRRNSILGALETLRTVDPGITLNNLLVFLYVAENEGLNVSELAIVCGLNKPTASRAARAMASRGEAGALPPYLGLVRLGREGPAKNSRTLRLTAAGEVLCARLEQLIVDAVPIRPSDEPAISRASSSC